MNADAASNFRSRRCCGLLSAGTALPSASRTMRRWTPNFREIPEIVPTPNSYSRRICSNNSTFASSVASYAFVVPSTKLIQLLPSGPKLTSTGGPN